MTKEPLSKHIREGFSKRLTQALNARGFPIKKRNKELRERYKSSQQAVNKWAHGTLPRIEILCAICEDLYINLTWLVTGKGTMDDTAKIDTERYEKVVTATEDLITEMNIEVSSLARAKLYNRHYNILSVSGELDTSRIKEDLELLNTASKSA